jgi:hypothetical protein
MNKLKCLLLLSLSFFIKNSAEAQDIPKSTGLYTIIVKSNGQYIDVAGGSDKSFASIISYGATGNKNQVFKVWIDKKTKYHTFNPEHNEGMRLAESLTQPNTIIQHSKQKKDHFRFYLTSRGNGYYSIQSKDNKQKGGKNVWTVINGKLKTAPYRGVSNQLFKFKKTQASSPTVKPRVKPAVKPITKKGHNLKHQGTYNIRLKVTGKYLGVLNGRDADLTMITSSIVGGSLSQMFKVWVDSKTGYCTFNPEHNEGMRLSESLKYPNTIVQYKNQKNNQCQFFLTRRVGEYYSIQSKHNKEKDSNFVWTVVGDRLITARFKGSSNQLFKFEVTDVTKARK